MRDFHIGDRVTFFDRAFYVRGLSPMSVARRSMQLENADTGERSEVWVDELASALPASAGASERSVASRRAGAEISSETL
jgi:hypothetical protein